MSSAGGSGDGMGLRYLQLDNSDGGDYEWNPEFERMVNAVLETVETHEDSVDADADQAEIAEIQTNPEDEPPLSEYKCVICLGVFINACGIHCGHKFCRFCIKKWFKARDSLPFCPTCRDLDVGSPVALPIIDNQVAALYSNLPETVQKQRAQNLKQRSEEERIELALPSHLRDTMGHLGNGAAAPPVSSASAPARLQLVGGYEEVFGIYNYLEPALGEYLVPVPVYQFPQIGARREVGPQNESVVANQPQPRQAVERTHPFARNQAPTLTVRYPNGMTNGTGNHHYANTGPNRQSLPTDPRLLSAMTSVPMSVMPCMIFMDPSGPPMSTFYGTPQAQAAQDGRTRAERGLDSFTPYVCPLPFGHQRTEVGHGDGYQTNYRRQCPCPHPHGQPPPGFEAMQPESSMRVNWAQPCPNGFSSLMPYPLHPPLPTREQNFQPIAPAPIRQPLRSVQPLRPVAVRGSGICLAAVQNQHQLPPPHVQRQWSLRGHPHGLVPLPFGFNDYLHFNFSYSPNLANHGNGISPIMDRPRISAVADPIRPNMARVDLSFNLLFPF